MRLITLTARNRAQVVRAAMAVLRRGGVIIYPTETTYGIGVDATKRRAIQKIFAIKGRPATKLLSVLMKDKRMASIYATLSPLAQKLWKRFLPGPLTLVLAGKGGRTVGVRVSSHPFAYALVRAFGRPITSTSVNRSGKQPLRDPKEIIRMFFLQKNAPDILIDAGVLPKRKSSTVVDCTGDSVRLLRKGAIAFHKIQRTQ